MSDRDYRFEYVSDLISQAEAEGIGIGEVALRYEVNHSGFPRETVLATMRSRWDNMRQSMQQGIESPQQTMGGMSQCAGQSLESYQPVFLDVTTVRQMARALAVNECRTPGSGAWQ